MEDKGQQKPILVVTDPEGRTVKTDFNAYGKITQSTDENGNTTHYSYDSQLNLTDLYTPGEQDSPGNMILSAVSSSEPVRQGKPFIISMGAIS